MKSNCYILYSPSADSFYIGASQEFLHQRLNAHNSGKYKHSYTAKANDWELFLVLPADDFAHAVRLERKVKRMKSRKYILNLKKYSELRLKVINETRNT